MISLKPESPEELRSVYGEMSNLELRFGERGAGSSKTIRPAE